MKHTHTHTHTHSHTHSLSLTHTHTHTLTHSLTHTHTYTHIHSDYSAVLSELNWPVSSSQSSHSLNTTCDEQTQTFSNLFTLLLKLDPHWPPEENSTRGTKEKTLHDPLILPLEYLVQPLRKRFRYHFMGDRRTNCLEKVVTVYIIPSSCEDCTCFHSQSGT